MLGTDRAVRPAHLPEQQAEGDGVRPRDPDVPAARLKVLIGGGVVRTWLVHR